MKTLDGLYTLAGPALPASQDRADDDSNRIQRATTAPCRRGVAWPNPRFTDNSNGTVTDNLTGLIWLKNANCFGTQTWANALSAANTLNSGECGLTDGSAEGDWRLPNVREQQSLIDYGRFQPGSAQRPPVHRRPVQLLLVEYHLRRRHVVRLGRGPGRRLREQRR